MRLGRAGFMAAVINALACASEAPRPAANGDDDLHTERLVDIGGIRLRVLEYGGSGEGLVFLAGLGDSPHSFDDLAPNFIHRYRVIAIARRGHGRSDAAPPYDHDTLVEDVRGVMDSLGVARAALVGWSLGSSEASEFAARYPERVTALVHLDGFDLSDPGLQAANANFPLAMFPDSADLASVDAFARWQKETWWPDARWTPAMRAAAADLVHSMPNGRVRLVANDTIVEAMFASAYRYRPRWSAVRVPTLAFFAEPYPAAYLPSEPSDSLRERVNRWLAEHQLPLYHKRLAQFRAAVPHARVVELARTNHAALPFQRHDTLLAEMRAFLLR